MAEAVLNDRIARRASLKRKIAIEVDSAGTDAYHAGWDADERTVATCKKHELPISCIARKVIISDFDKFDYILAMDESNLGFLQRRRPPTCTSRISLFGAFDPSGKPGVIDDPYYGGSSGFEKCYEQCVRYADGFLDFLDNGGSSG